MVELDASSLEIGRMMDSIISSQKSPVLNHLNQSLAKWDMEPIARALQISLSTIRFAKTSPSTYPAIEKFTNILYTDTCATCRARHLIPVQSLRILASLRSLKSAESLAPARKEAR
jgi:hypothetical protein